MYIPSAIHSMQQNSEMLFARLRHVLCISIADSNDENEINAEFMDTCIRNDEIIDFAMQRDLLIFVSIDGSLSNDSATCSIIIVAPDIESKDNNAEWQHRPAKILLIRSWKLPKHWGTGLT